MTTTEHAGVWRWLAAFLAGVVLAGMPAGFVAFSAPGRTDYEDLRADVVASQVQLARIEERLIAADAADEERVARIERRLDQLAEALTARRP